MSDNVENTENTEAEAAPKVDKRHRKIMAPMNDAGQPQEGGELAEVNRTDYIRMLWTAGQVTEDGAHYMMTRSEIRKHVNEDCTAENGENEIPYQIVFAATKDLEGGPSEEEVKDRKEAAKAAKAAEKAAAKEAADAEKGEADAEADAGEDLEGEEDDDGEPIYD